MIDFSVLPPVTACPLCSEGWRPLDMVYCAECEAKIERERSMLSKAPVAWRVMCTSNGATGYLYTEKLPFEPGPGVRVRREPEPLYAALPAAKAAGDGPEKITGAEMDAIETAAIAGKPLTVSTGEPVAWADADLSEPPFAYRFEYADGSAFEVLEDGSTFLVKPDGRREEKRGKITSNIRRLIGRAIILRSRAAPPASGSVRAAVIEECAKAAEKAWPKAHTYASENADLYRGQDHAVHTAVKAIRALSQKLHIEAQKKLIELTAERDDYIFQNKMAKGGGGR